MTVSLPGVDGADDRGGPDRQAHLPCRARGPVPGGRGPAGRRRPGPRTLVTHIFVRGDEELGEERRQTLLGGAEPAPRRSGRRPRA